MIMKRVFIITGIVVLAIVAIPAVLNAAHTVKLKGEIDRVVSKANLSPASVECRNVELAQICYVEHAAMSITQAKGMLMASGYVLVDEQYNGKSGVSATNESVGVRVDSEPASFQGDLLILKFKDINVTL